MHTEGERDEALTFLMNHETGVLATISEANEPHARLVYYTVDDAFNIYFITLKNTRKVADLGAHHQAAFVVSQEDMPRTVQIEGKVTDVTDTTTLNPIIADFVKRLSEKEYGIPLAHMDASELRFFKLEPSWVRWGEFTFGQGTDHVLTEVNPDEPSL